MVSDLEKTSEKEEKGAYDVQIRVEWMDDLFPLRRTESWQKGRIERRWMGRNNGTWLVWMSLGAGRGMERNVGEVEMAAPSLKLSISRLWSVCLSVEYASDEETLVVRIGGVGVTCCSALSRGEHHCDG